MRILLLGLVTAFGVATALPAAADVHDTPTSNAKTSNARPSDEQRARPLPNAHAHNDYEHDRPLFDALDQGFTSVEADIYLVDGQLLVGHDRADLTPERTLQRLYLDPLAEQVRKHHGSVYPGYRKGIQLLIDIKENGEGAYRKLDSVLRNGKYSHLFTGYRNGKVRHRAVTAVISGDRPAAYMRAQKSRFAFYDGRIVGSSDLGSDAKFASLVSDDWAKVFGWTGTGAMPADQRAKLRAIVTAAHRAHQKVRFWNTPDVAGSQRAAVWREDRAAGVDYLNTDDLAGLRAFLTE